MNLKQGRAQRHEMRTRERDRPLAFGARVGIVLQHRRSVDRTCIESLREEASTKHARVGWCDQLLDAVVMVKSDMVLGVDRDNEREGSGGTASDATRRDGACATRCGISCTFVHRGVCGLVMKREGGEKYNVFSSPFSVPLPGPIMTGPCLLSCHLPLFDPGFVRRCRKKLSS